MRRLKSRRGYTLVDTLLGILLLAGTATIIAGYGTLLIGRTHSALNFVSAGSVVTSINGYAAENNVSPRATAALEAAASGNPSADVSWEADVADTGLVNVTTGEGTVCVLLPVSPFEAAAFSAGACA